MNACVNSILRIKDIASLGYNRILPCRLTLQFNILLFDAVQFECQINKPLINRPLMADLTSASKYYQESSLCGCSSFFK